MQAEVKNPLRDQPSNGKPGATHQGDRKDTGSLRSPSNSVMLFFAFSPLQTGLWSLHATIMSLTLLQVMLLEPCKS